MNRPSAISTGGYGRPRPASKSTPSPQGFEARLCWGEIENPNAPSAPVSPASAPGHMEKARGKLLKNGSNGSLGSVSTPNSTASCPNLRRPTGPSGRQQALARLRPSPTNPRPLVPSGENLNGSASLANWRDYIDDKRRNPYRGIRGGFAPPSWYKIMTGSQTYLVR
mmetsp:Transcript_85364/g.135306  ORF Transcript_85364/g.135306 Transcript_85364/m.135306 type:complete len:167 (-) Transcript_85364:60-560(-)